MANFSKTPCQLDALKSIYEALYDNYKNRFYYDKNTFDLIERKKNQFFNSLLELQNVNKISNFRDMPLKIGVVGSFSSGKSSIINSIIGEELLGVDISPSTSKITILKWGNEQEFYVNTSDNQRHKISKIEFQKLSVKKSTYETSPKDDTNNISFLEIYYPSKVLHQFNLVDTPGFSSISTEDDELTRKWIPEVDVLLWVFDINKGSIDKDELNILEKYKAYTNVAILNKMDGKAPSKRKKLMDAFASGCHFNLVIPYAARPVLDFSISLKEKQKIYKETVDHGFDLLVNDIEFAIYCEKSDIYIKNINENNVVLKNCFPSMNKSEFYDYYMKFIDYLDSLRKDIIKIRYEKYDYLINDLKNSHKASLKEIQKKLENDLEFIQQKVTSLEAEVDHFFKDFDKKSEAIYQSNKISLVDQLYDSLFRISMNEGLIFNETYVKLEFFDNDTIKRIIYNFFKGLIHKLAMEINIFINNSELKDVQKRFDDNFIKYLEDENIVLRFDIEYLSDKFAIESCKSVYSLSVLWQDIKIKDNINKIVKDIKKAIDLCTADRSLLEVACDYLNIELLKLFFYYKEEFLIANEKINYCIKETTRLLNN